MATKKTADVIGYALVSPDSDSKSHATRPRSQESPWKLISAFTRENSWVLVVLLLSTALTAACFAFTYWLSGQVFFCPSWTVNCKVHPAVTTFVEHLGLVQGIVSSVYGIAIAGMAYAAYQLAETTLWPLLCGHPLTFKSIDRFLAHARGSLASFPYALWHSRTLAHVVVVLLIGTIGIVIQVNSAIIGWVYTISPIPTPLQSFQFQGGGMGFGFSQGNPPQPISGEATAALSLYSSWSTQQSDEPLPDLRGYYIHRANFSVLGNFTVMAVNVSQRINCSASSIDITGGDLPDYYTVATGLGQDTWLRFCSGILTSWVDSYTRHSNTSVVTRIMFAVMNGTIEGGQKNFALSPDFEEYLGPPYVGTSSLACDVNIEFLDSFACNRACNHDIATNISWLGGGTMGVGGWGNDLSDLGLTIAAASTQMGPYIFGAQPAYALGPLQPNSTYALPVAWADAPLPGVMDISQANLTNFIRVASGAMITSTAGAWPPGNTTVTSSLPLLRLQQSRSYALLGPPALVLASVVVLAMLCVVLYIRAGLREIRLGWTSEIIGSCMQRDFITFSKGGSYDKKASVEKKTLEKIRLHYEKYGNGTEGLIDVSTT